MRQGTADVASGNLGQVEAHLTLREIPSEKSTGPDGMLWCEFEGFGRFQLATLG